MDNIFSFLNDFDNYEERKIDFFEDGDLLIPTALVHDGKQPYETAVAHPEYNDGKYIIVQGYDTPEEAQDGHERWVDKMISDNLPEYLVDCANAGVSQLGAAVGMRMVFKRGVSNVSKDSG